MRKTLLTLTVLGATLLAPLAVHMPMAQTASVVPVTATARVIVKYKAGTASTATSRVQGLSVATANAAADAATAAQRAGRAQALGQRVGLALRVGADVGERSHVVRASGITSEQLAQRLAADADVEYAVPDGRRRAMVAPNDPFYAASASIAPAVGQWYLRAPTVTAPASINVEPAWAVTTGNPALVVAVLDSGVRFDHPDLKKVANGGNLLDGYDMISDVATANDFNGRDADASDPGDFLSQADINSGNFPDCSSADIGDSSWHGTATASVIGALTDNGIGMASVGRNVLVLPVRVLGKCGGLDSDIIAAMLWSAGIHVPGVPDNLNPASIINLSLGGPGACNALYRDAVAQVNARNVVVVASAGNSAGHAVATPANCPGVIAVSGLRHVGSKVGYSDIGPEITISAPGGNCVNDPPAACLYPILTASNSGFTSPAGNTYAGEAGTSFSAPLVAGTVALMISANDAAVPARAALTPLDVKLILQGTARPFPASGLVDSSGSAVRECTAPQYDSAGKAIDQDQCYCSTGTCGGGMLDAGRAVVNAAGGGVGNGLQARIDVDSRTAISGRTLALSGGNSIVVEGANILTYQWALEDGGGVVTQFDSSGTVVASGANVNVTPHAAGRFVVSLTVTDDSGFVSKSRLAIAAADQAQSSGGGGALGAGWLALLLTAVLALRASPAERAARTPASKR